MNKYLIKIFILLSLTIFSGCGVFQRETKLVYDALSTKEAYLMQLTGNKVLLYQLENIPHDKSFQLTLSYEVYEKGEKVKEEVIASIGQDTSDGFEIENQQIGINIQENEITALFGSDGFMSSGTLETTEDVSRCNYATLTQNVPLPLGAETYIFYGTSSSSLSTNIPLGALIDSTVRDSLTTNHDTIMLIKLSFLSR